MYSTTKPTFNVNPQEVSLLSIKNKTIKKHWKYSTIKQQLINKKPIGYPRIKWNLNNKKPIGHPRIKQNLIDKKPTETNKYPRQPSLLTTKTIT
jgi:hypothetical protein